MMFLRRVCAMFSERFPALLPHKSQNAAIVPVFIIAHQQPFELRYTAFGDNQQATALGDQIVIGENHGGTLVAIIEDSGFHAVETKLDGNFHGLCVRLSSRCSLTSCSMGRSGT